MVEFYLKLKLILRTVHTKDIYVWEIDNFVIKSDIFRRFFICKNILKKLCVTMTTTLNTSCLENIMVLSANISRVSSCRFVDMTKSAALLLHGCRHRSLANPLVIIRNISLPLLYQALLY